MKLTAIRLREVGRFREPIALEGLSGSLDVLAGPNELGKSTILRAVRLALFEQHTSKAKKKLEPLRPYSGGAPLIEVDFETGGRRWRIRKQFLSSASAELRDLGAGTVARGADAESRLAELLAGDQRFALLWVDQGTPLAAVEPANTAGGVLNAAIESEVETVADGGAARAVQAEVRAALAELVTPGRGQPTGRYKTAIDECARLARERDAARERLRHAQRRLDELQELRERIAALSDPAAAAQRAETAAAAAHAFEEARAAREACGRAEAEVRMHEQTVAALKAALGELQGKITDLAKLEEAERREAPELVEVSRRAAESEARAGEARKRRDEIKAALAAAEKERKALELAARRAEVAARLETARAAAGELKRLTAALAGNGADETLIKSVRREAQEIATIAARLSAAAPSVKIAYAKGGAGTLRAGGRVLADGETLTPTRPLTIEIEGIGTLTVAPGNSATLLEDEAARAAHETQLAALLKRAGAASVEEAEARAVEHRDLEARLAAAAREVKSAAPEGLERLERLCGELSVAAAGVDAPPRAPEDLEEEARELMERLGEAEAQLGEAAAAQAEAREGLVQMQTRAEERRHRVAELAAALGDAAARKSAHEKQATAVAQAEAALNRAVREHAAWREKAPSDERVGELKSAAEAARSAQRSAEQELAALRRTEAGIEGELRGDRTDDVRSRVAELEEAQAAAAARLKTLEDETAALQLLARELEAAQSETRDRFARPVLDRLGPYLALVFPHARATLGEGLALETLERTNGKEPLVRLSEGTQEQLAVLARLGFARLLAETGQPAPLILDDALVYADDERIERMFDALKLAAQSHQVLVLTCRQRTFQSLGGNRVEIVPWRPE